MNDIHTSTQEIIELGFDRILTSGTGTNVIAGLETLKSLQQNFGDQVQIMPGGGINSQNVREILEITKVTNIHGSASKKILRDTRATAFPSSALEIKTSQVDEISAIKSKLYI